MPEFHRVNHQTILPDEQLRIPVKKHMNEALIEILGAQKTFRGKSADVRALDGVDLRVEEGDIFGIIGFSGAGKSTLLRLINRLETPDEGIVVVNGRNLAELSASHLRTMRREIGMVFQQFNLLERKSVFHNVAQPLILAGMPKTQVRARVEELLSFVELEEKRDTCVFQLSGGQKQRVGIARALATSPKILLCDEATSALDPTTTEAILGLLKKINRDLGVTIVLITHQMEVIRRICTRVAVMDEGRIVEAGSALEVFTHPHEEITKRFVRTVMNDRIPEAMAALLADDLRHFKVEKLLFVGEIARKPILSTISQVPGLELNILGANVEEIEEQLVCLYLVQLIGEEEAITRAEEIIDSSDVVRIPHIWPGATSVNDEREE